MVDGLLAVDAQGRHRYYRIASAEVADALEGLATLAQSTSRRAMTDRELGTGLRFARSCYDHLAGRLAVRLRLALLERGLLVEDGLEHSVTAYGETVFLRFGLDLQKPRQEWRAFARACLDWSERRPHIAGSFGAGVLRRLLEQRWLLRCPGSRELEVTQEGWLGLVELLGVDPSALFE